MRVFIKKSVWVTLSVVILLNAVYFLIIRTNFSIEVSKGTESTELTIISETINPIKTVTTQITAKRSRYKTTTKSTSRVPNVVFVRNDQPYEAMFLKQKSLIEREMQNYTTLHQQKDWKHLQMVNGGQPIRNVIFTTWRSGSTFLGAALNSYPGTFYNYEPLMSFPGGKRARSGKMVEEYLYVIRNLFKCDYSNLPKYLKFARKIALLHTHNTRLWQNGTVNKILGGDPHFLAGMCKLFPFQVTKLIRLRLKFAEQLIQDEKLDARVLFLVRDPRAVMHSRRRVKSWCKPSRDCWEPQRLCADLVDDYESAAELRRKYPQKFMIIRYEDIALNPYSGIKKVLEFFRQELQPEVISFIKSHTTKNNTDPLSTFRDSKSTPFKWIHESQSDRNETHKVQSVCKKALQLWGYGGIDFSKNTSIVETDILLEPPWIEMMVPQDLENLNN